MPSTKPLLLIAEDDPDDQLMILDAVNELCPHILDVTFVCDGVELLAFLQGEGSENRKPDLVLMDLNMPRKDGRTALQEIKADPGLCDIPVVVLTTSSSADDVEFCECNGSTEYFCKPNTFSGLSEIMGYLYANYLAG